MSKQACIDPRTESPLPNAARKLFERFTVRDLQLSNRVVMAPMTRNMAQDGIPRADNAVYYRRRAQGGAGLIVTEGTWIPHEAASNRVGVPCFYGDEALEGWRGVVDAVHDANGKIIPQLWHVGMVRRPGDNAFYPSAAAVGPSGIAFEPANLTPVVSGPPMSISDIEETINAFGEAAANAKAIGFDGIEIHGAHGYLIDQFFWHVTNQRTDEFGGADIGDRTKYAVEVIRECRRRVGPGFPISFRFSQWKISDYSARLVQTPSELERLLGPLVEAGVDLLHCSTRRFWEPGFAGSDLTLAGWARKVSGVPTIAVGSVGLSQAFEIPSRAAGDSRTTSAPLDRVARLLDEGQCDLVAVGRSMIANADWAEKVQRGAQDELAPYTQGLLTSLQ